MIIPVYSEYEQCQGCRRCIERRDLVPAPGGPRGPGLRFWVVVGESTKIDMQEGSILTAGPRAKIVDGVLKAGGLSPSRVYKGAVNRCIRSRVDEDLPDDKSTHCSSWTTLDALYHRPLLVIAMGEEAQKHFIHLPSTHRKNLVMSTRADYHWDNPLLEKVAANRKVSIKSAIEEDRSHPLVIKSPCIDMIVRRKNDPAMRKEVQKLVSTLKSVMTLCGTLPQQWTKGQEE